jgi:PadR family transcriptional regulator, regulatory protein AphA
MSPMIKQPLTTEHALLGLLRRRPMHAYEMHQMLLQSEALGLVWRLKQSQLYALLGRLEEAGYIENTIEAQPARPARKIMRLTPSGREAFKRWVASPVEHGRDFRIEFLAKLFFARQEDTAAANALIERQRRACQAWLVDLHAQAEAIRGERPYDWLVHQFRIGQTQATLSWLDTTEAMLHTPAFAH